MLTYPAMNGKIVNILKLDANNPTALYAAARIEALETALRRVVGASEAKLIAAAVLAEREACAALAERFAEADSQAMADGAVSTIIGEHTERTGCAIAAAIRARGKGE